MNRRWSWIHFPSVLLRTAILMFAIPLTACTTAEIPLVEYQNTVEDLTSLPPLTQITLDQAVHFHTPLGEPVVVSAGTYQVQSAGDTVLQLTNAAGGDLLLIAAMPAPQLYLVDQREPVAIALAGTNEDSHHILYAHADGTALDASGSYSGIQSRAGFRPIAQSKAEAALTSKVAALALASRPLLYHVAANGDLLAAKGPGIAQLVKVGAESGRTIPRYVISTIVIMARCPTMVTDFESGSCRFHS